MADAIFTVSKGAWAERIRAGASKTGILLLETAEADAVLQDHDDVAAMIAAANTEAAFTNYGRKVDISGEVINFDDANERTDYDIPDQTFTAAGNGANETLAKLITFYNTSAGDGNQELVSHHDFVVTTDGSDLTAQINSAGLLRAS